MWHAKYNECQCCGTTTTKYQGKGICYNCYCRKRYANDERVREAKRIATAKWVSNNRERFLSKQKEYAKNKRM